MTTNISRIRPDDPAHSGPRALADFVSSLPFAGTNLTIATITTEKTDGGENAEAMRTESGLAHTARRLAWAYLEESMQVDYTALQALARTVLRSRSGTAKAVTGIYLSSTNIDTTDMGAEPSLYPVVRVDVFTEDGADVELEFALCNEHCLDDLLDYIMPLRDGRDIAPSAVIRAALRFFNRDGVTLYALPLDRDGFLDLTWS